MAAIGLDHLAGPTTYTWWVPVLGIVLLALGVWLGLQPRRARRREQQVQQRIDAATTAELRADLVDRIDAIERALAAGHTDPAGAALGLAHVARDWAARSAVSAGQADARELHAATGADLAARGFDDLAELVRSTYPTAFEGDTTDVTSIVLAVRRLIE